VTGQDEPDLLPHLASALRPDEPVHIRARARDALIAVTDRRMIIATEQRLALDVPFQKLRRLQFDIERDRPATLVVVPEHPGDEPQVLAIPVEEYEAVASALVDIGRRLHDSAASA
jgi:hypothetical protein